MPLSPARVLKQFRYAMYFDGVDDYVFNTSFNWGVLRGGFAVVLWVNPANKAGDIVRHYSTPWGYLQVAYDLVGRRIGFLIRSTDTNEILNVPQSVGKSPPNTFTHFVFTWNTERGCVYSNGVLDTCRSDTRAGKGVNFTGYYIGASLFWGWFQGYVSQVLVYSHVLSDSEVRWNYINPDNPVRNGLILWLKADPQYIKDIDGDGLPEWLDLSGYDNHGKIYGARLVELIKTPARTLTTIRIVPVAR